MNKELPQLLTLVESLKLNDSVGWKIPCTNDPSDFFDLEINLMDGQYFWQFKNFKTDDWVHSTSTNLIKSLENNDINLDNLAAQLKVFILSKISHSYELVQHACQIFGEELVYDSIEDHYEKLDQETRILFNKQEYLLNTKIKLQ